MRPWRIVGSVALVCALGISLGGCAQRWVAQATTGARAFVAHGSSMLFCDATGSRPRCISAREVEH